MDDIIMIPTRLDGSNDELADMVRTDRLLIRSEVTWVDVLLAFVCTLLLQLLSLLNAQVWFEGTDKLSDMCVEHGSNRNALVEEGRDQQVVLLACSAESAQGGLFFDLAYC